MIVKNVPFETTAAELRSLFGTFASIKRLTMPKKFDGGHRGFAFIDFDNRVEAQKAMNAVSATHFYGRHLVLEWSSEAGVGEEEVDQLRDKVKRQNTQLIAVAANKKTQSRTTGRG